MKSIKLIQKVVTTQTKLGPRKKIKSYQIELFGPEKDQMLLVAKECNR